MDNPFAGLSALVADDYETIRKRLVSVLIGLGFEVTEAVNGLEALTLLRERRFDVLFTDIVMPEMDGFELCIEVRKTPGLLTLPIVVVSTHCDIKHITRALRYGADDYLPKPIGQDLVRRVVARVLTPTLQEVNHG